MGEVRSLNAIKAEREGDNTLLSPKEMMLDAVADIDAGKIAPTRAMVIVLNDQDGTYQLNWYASGARCSDMISMCEVTKALLLTQMGFIPGD